MAAPIGTPTEFLNVDVDVYSRTPLDLLAASFGRKVLIHHVGREGGRYGLHFSLASSYFKSADLRVQRLVRLVLSLPPVARSLWNAATSRTFNLGIQGGHNPSAHKVLLRVPSVALVASVQARIVITTYAVLRHS